MNNTDRKFVVLLLAIGTAFLLGGTTYVIVAVIEGTLEFFRWSLFAQAVFGIVTTVILHIVEDAYREMIDTLKR